MGDQFTRVQRCKKRGSIVVVLEFLGLVGRIVFRSLPHILFEVSAVIIF